MASCKRSHHERRPANKTKTHCTLDQSKPESAVPFFTQTRAVRVLGNYICKTKMLRCDDTLPWPFFLSSKTNIVIRTYFQ